MTNDAEAIRALLVEASEAHDTYEKAELNGIYDQDWARWYAAYATEHGLGDLIGHHVAADALAAFLASSNADLQQDPQRETDWATYTARRIATEL